MDASNKIDVVTIDEDTQKEITKLSETYWKDYLEDQNYNTDLSKMCEICIAEQVEKYGSQTIPCRGLLTLENQVGSENYELLKDNLSKAEFDIYRGVLNAYDFMDVNCDIDNIGKETRAFRGRWYQEHLLNCSAKSKVVRMRKAYGQNNVFSYANYI